MSEPGELRQHSAAEVFEAERPRLLGLAYRMLGSLSDADDVVQDAWFRWEGADRDAIEVPAAWLTTVTTRLALDRIRAIERRKEDYVGPWLPEPVALAAGPEEDVELAESLTLGFLVLLDRLGPTERAVFLLADVFREPYAAIAVAVDKSEEACRQIASRARKKVRAGREPAVQPADRVLLAELVAAVAVGDVDRVVALCDPSVTLVSDGGPARHAARRPVVGVERVTRFLVNVGRRLAEGTVSIEDVNGVPAFVSRDPKGTVVTFVEHRDGTIVHVTSLLNPDKMAGVDQPHVMR
jgi:RNA polymerase sigma-70 factor (ECF subfamily)